jgi:hypothetical protein
MEPVNQITVLPADAYLLKDRSGRPAGPGDPRGRRAALLRMGHAPSAE